MLAWRERQLSHSKNGLKPSKILINTITQGRRKMIDAAETL